MLAARVFFLADVFNMRTSAVVHARRFDFLATTECGARIKIRMSRSVSKLRLSLASPPVRWKAIGKPPKSVFK